MQNAETVLGVLRDRGRRGLPCGELYRQLFNPHLYELAYGRLYSNHGAMTPGACGETADGMSLGKIGRIIDALRHERYRFQPVKRVHIPKKSGKLRPLAVSSATTRSSGAMTPFARKRSMAAKGAADDGSAQMPSRAPSVTTQRANSSSGNGSKNSGPTCSFPFNAPGLRLPFASMIGTNLTTGCDPRAIIISSPLHAFSMSRERLVLA